MHMYVCMYIHMYVCMYVHTYVCMYIHMYVCMYVHTYVCMYVHTYVYILLCVDCVGEFKGPIHAIRWRINTNGQVSISVLAYV